MGNESASGCLDWPLEVDGQACSEEDKASASGLGLF